MIKLSTTSWIFLIIGIFGILVLSLNVAESQQSQEQDQLNEEIALVQKRLGKYPVQQISAQKEELESQMAEAESQLKVDKVGLYWSTESIEASDALFEVAEASLTEVTGISSPGVTTEELEGVTFSVLPLTVTIEGDVLNLVAFIYKWTHEYPTGVVQSVAITVPEVTEEEEEAEAEAEGAAAETEEEKPSATIDLLIYSYEGD